MDVHGEVLEDAEHRGASFFYENRPLWKGSFEGDGPEGEKEGQEGLLKTGPIIFRGSGFSGKRNPRVSSVNRATTMNTTIRNNAKNATKPESYGRRDGFAP
jgi:hypothetical protein